MNYTKENKNQLIQDISKFANETLYNIKNFELDISKFKNDPLKIYKIPEWEDTLKKLKKNFNRIMKQRREIKNL